MTNSEHKNLGPLASLVGVWEGDKGKDEAPGEDRGLAQAKFRERLEFEYMGDVNNHEQKLYALRYKTTAWKIGDDEPFHEELGYWLWDAKEKQVMRCFMVPRGVTIIAGGAVEENASSFNLAADVGSETYGICSNKFLDREFKTVRYELKIIVHDENSFTYEEDTQLRIKGKDDLFHHTDKNTVTRV